MKKRTERRKLTDELRREYDLYKLKGVRGNYATRYQAGTNLVLCHRTWPGEPTPCSIN